MPNPIALASAQVANDIIKVELVGDNVVVRWPEHPLQVSRASFPDAAATLTRLFANASVELSRLKAGRKR
jgi:hypothetical protein